MLTTREWLKEERPGERLLRNGPGTPSDTPLLPVLLRKGSDQEDSPQLSIHLLRKFHSLPRCAQVSPVELCSVRGIGPAKAAQLKTGIELGRRSLASSFSGGGLTVPLRQVFQAAVCDSAASVIFLHNDTGGDPIPGNEDRKITKSLVSAGRLMGVPILDHIIVGDENYFSFADTGYMKNHETVMLASENNSPPFDTKGE